MAMKTEDLTISTDGYPEIVIGLVAPVGVDLVSVVKKLDCSLKEFGYDEVVALKISDIIRECEGNPNKKGEKLKKIDDKSFKHNLLMRYKKYIDKGNKIRKIVKKKSVLALCCVANIRLERNRLIKERKKKNKKNPKPLRVAYILNQLKSPEEIQVLKHVYGSNYFSLAIISSDDTRIKNIMHRMPTESSGRLGSVGSDAVKITEMDSEASNRSIKKEFTQNIGGCLDVSDYFIAHDVDVDNLKNDILGFLDRIFERPYITPDAEEYCMSVAFNAALRSADMGTQIGCCIASEEGEIIATGFNEVPCCPGGGQYWHGKKPDQRDWARDNHSLSTIREEYIESVCSEVNAVLRKSKLKNKKLSKQIEKGISDSRIKDIIEFGRSTHAEMSAILEAARKGRSIEGATLYVTTFPCHLCTVNIVASGVKKVVYLKQYPKSRAERLFSTEINSNDFGRSLFRPFIGVSPRYYGRLYSQHFESNLKGAGGVSLDWKRRGAPKLCNYRSYHSYGLNEKIAVHYLKKICTKKGITFENIKDELKASKGRIRKVFKRSGSLADIVKDCDKKFE